MYQDGELIGQNMFMRTAITSDDGRSIPIMTMGPICIKNEYKRKGYGKILPEGEDASFFLCRELIPGYLDGITGEYATPEGYLIDEKEAEEFDQNFPYKEKNCRDRFFDRKNFGGYGKAGTVNGL